MCVATSAQQLIIANCCYEQSIVSGTTAVMSQCFAMMMSHSNNLWKLGLDKLSNIKTKGNYFVVLASQDKNKTVLLHNKVHPTSLGESAANADL